MTEPATGEWARRYGDAIAAGDDGAAQQVVDDALAAGVEPVQVIEGLLTPAMRRIGDLWEENRIGIADEHLATANHRAGSRAPVPGAVHGISAEPRPANV